MTKRFKKFANAAELPRPRLLQRFRTARRLARIRMKIPKRMTARMPR